MHHRITTTLRYLRQDLAERLEEDAVHDACRQAGHTWRPCLLTPVAILHWFLIQVLNGNTALVHVSLLAGRSFTDAAFCLARARLPLAVYRAVLKGLTAGLTPDTRRWGKGTFLILDAEWKVCRILGVDCCHFSGQSASLFPKSVFGGASRI